MSSVGDCISDEDGAALLAGVAPSAVRERAEIHADGCETCRGFLAAILRVRASSVELDTQHGPGGEQTLREPRWLESRPDAWSLADVADRKLGRYRLLDEIGSGGMGVVYAAWDELLERKVAIKIVRPDGGPGASAAALTARLVREAQAIARLSHPNVVPIYDVGTVGDRVFVALEHVDGRTLREWLRESPRSWRAVVDVFVQAGRGLVAAHGVQLVHRDFKPTNVLVDRAERVRVTDFGLARMHGASDATSSGDVDLCAPSDPSLTATGVIVGTPAYMAPEQHMAGAADPRSDQFSFCVALFEAVHGVLPYEGRALDRLAHAKLSEEIRTTGLRSIPAGVDAAIRRGLAASPAARWPTMQALVDALQRETQRSHAGPLVAVASIGVALLAWAAWPTSTRCDGAERMAGIWDDERRATIGQPAVRREIDGWAAEWIATYDRVCRGDASIASTTDAAMTCLARRRSELNAIVDALAEAPEMVEMVDRPPAIARCLAPSEDVAATRDAELAARIEAVRDQMDAALARRVTGHYTRARDISVAALEAAEELDVPALTVEARLSLAFSLINLSDWQESEALLVRTFDDARREGLDRLAAEAALHLAYVSGERGHPDDALAWTRHAEALLARLPFDEPWLRASLMTFEADARAQLGDRVEAERLLRAAAAAHERHGWSPRALAMTHNNLASLLSEDSRTAEAEAEYRIAQEIRIRELGPRHPDVALGLANLASVQSVGGRYDEALESLAAAEDILTDSVEPRHTTLGAIALQRAMVYVRKGQPAEARPHAQRGLDIIGAAYGADDSRTAQAWNILGAVEMQIGDLDAGEIALQRAHTILETAGPATRANMFGVRANLARIAALRGRHVEAERLARESLAGLREALGEHDSTLNAAYEPLALALLGQGRTEEALAATREALAVLGDAPKRGDSTTDLIEFIALAARWDAGDDRAARRRAIEALATRIERGGGDVLDLAIVRGWLADHPEPR